MKIEKLTENKIRILLNKQDFKDKGFDLSKLLDKSIEANTLFLELLNLAEKEVGFTTDGSRLLIESFSSSDDNFVFMITKFNEENKNYQNPRRIVARKKEVMINLKNITYQFETFENFCNFCNCLNISNILVKNFAKHISLHLYKDRYFLIIKNVNESNKNINKILSIVSEFAKLVSSSSSFEGKILEYGKVIIPKNAFSVGIKYFSKR